MTQIKKLYAISELFEDDESKVATAIKMCITKEDHNTILKNISNQDIAKYSNKIDILYKAIQDHYNIDGLVFLVELIHSNTEHGEDIINSNIDSKIIVGDDCAVQLTLFEEE